MNNRFYFLLTVLAVVASPAWPVMAQAPVQDTAAATAPPAPAPPPLAAAVPMPEIQGSGGMDNEQLVRRIHAPLVSVGGTPKPTDKRIRSAYAVIEPF